jgi:hypothetical protein
MEREETTPKAIDLTNGRCEWMQNERKSGHRLAIKKNRRSAVFPNAG